MSRIPLISEAESVVMEALWAQSPLTAEQVVQAAAATQSWQDATVKTLLNRLLKKAAIRAEPDGRRYLYWPVLHRDQWLASVSKGFVDRMFGGRVAPLVAHFSQQRKISKADLAELRRLLDEMDDGR